MGRGLLKIQRKPAGDRTILYLHLPKEWVDRLGLREGDYVEWEIDGRGRLILKKLR